MRIDQINLPDLAARTSALTAVDRSLLVEAGAGSGKTSIMAGRVAVLFARGVAPKHVAAITFTEFAASELMIRIERFVTGLARGEVPPDLEPAFSHGVSAVEKANLHRARKTLDQLTCTTIHGFAQALIKPYPVEASIDPGAEIVDPAEADLAFEERFRAWLNEHLSGNAEDDVVAELVLANEKAAFKFIGEIANFLRRNRDARPVASAWSNAAVKPFARAAAAFKKELETFDFCEDKTDNACRAFIALVDVLDGPALGAHRPANRALVGAIDLPRDESCFTENDARRQLRAKTKWEQAASAGGWSKADATQAYDAVNARYEACHDAFEALLSAAAGELLVRLVAAMQGLMQEWRQYKRAAALLDFDDLLYAARDLLAEHDPILAKRYRHVLVDEFQDTDPLQIEILWRLCGVDRPGRDGNPPARALRPGALFLVGDPKQAIYRFRGADVNAYVGARDAIGKAGLLQITANFRSVAPILSMVNRNFAEPLAEAAGQPGFTALSPIHAARSGAFAVAALDVAAEGERPSAAMLRDAEADRVAELCGRLTGNVQVRDPAKGTLRPCRLGDIALLAPVGTELWRFEEALEERGIAVSTQAGKGFFRRQEIQDLIALTRALADARDTLALGALLRGSLVGLTEAELLDIAEGLSPDPDRPDRLPQLHLWTEIDQVAHPLARSVIESLQSLGRRARSTTPYALLSDAVGMLSVRPQLRQRFRAGADRAFANVDLFLEMARAYDVRGLRAFARDMHANWKDAVRQAEGRPDAEEQSVALITIHVAKGLEWPIVIPINMTGTPRAETAVVHDRRTGRFSIPVLGAAPAGHVALADRNEEELARERVRLWYVATTRARDLLVLPRHAGPLGERSWAQIVDLGLESLAAIDPESLGSGMAAPAPAGDNAQSRTMFAQEAARVAESAHTIVWQRPSRDEIDPLTRAEPIAVFTAPEDAEEAIEIPRAEVAGGATRGTILHKLMEEVLSGETADTAVMLERRAAELAAQLGITPTADPKTGISPKELAATVVRIFNLPEIASLRPRLAAEHTVYGRQADGTSEILVSGIADAVASDGRNQIDVIVDWKSDVEVTQDKLATYRGQLDAYCRNTGAKAALLVLMTMGTVLRTYGS